MRARDVGLGVALALVAGQLAAGLWWQTLRFPRFAFFDNGWALTTNALLDSGAIPTQDFAYTYGLNSLLVHRAVYAVFGATPHVTSAMVLFFALALVVGVFRLAAAAQLGWAGMISLLFIAPLIMPLIDIPSPTHALEATLLVWGLAEQTRGKLGRALVFATLAVTVKPTLAYVYGAFLVVQILVSPAPSFLARFRLIVPAAVALVVLLAIPLLRFGLGPLLATQLPLNGRLEYEDLGYGIFGPEGRLFWIPAAAGNWEYILVTPFGIWALCSLLLIAGAFAGLRYWRSDRVAPVVVALAVWQAVFVLTAYGNGGSWVYYPYVPFVGGALALDRLPRWFGLKRSWPVSLVLAFGFCTFAAKPSWRYLGLSLEPKPPDCTRSEVMADLYSFPLEIEYWRRTRELTKTEPVYALYRMGATPFLFPEIDGPKSWYLSQPLASRLERETMAEGLRRAKWLVVSTYMTHTLPKWVETLVEVNGFQIDPELPPADATDSDTARAIFRVYRRESR